MWQKIKCWLGWHEYKEVTARVPNGFEENSDLSFYEIKNCNL